jgi:hypothetical protein
LILLAPDFIISCGSTLAAANYVFSRENLARSVVIMRPSLLSLRRFDLVIMPWHDNPPKRKNVMVTEGALNLINESYLNSQAQALKQRLSINEEPVFGLLVGGDTRKFSLAPEVMQEVIRQLKTVLEKYGGRILTTTSRRTSSEIEELLKRQLQGYSANSLLIIASENNPPYAIGGILALSKIVVVSPESISMISEAASSGKYIVVFKSRIDRRHRRFLSRMADKNYIYLCEPEDLGRVIKKILEERPAINTLRDNLKIGEALKKLI